MVLTLTPSEIFFWGTYAMTKPIFGLIVAKMLNLNIDAYKKNEVGLC
jgi:hypothetical protein